MLSVFLCQAFGKTLPLQCTVVLPSLQQHAAVKTLHMFYVLLTASFASFTGALGLFSMSYANKHSTGLWAQRGKLSQQVSWNSAWWLRWVWEAVLCHCSDLCAVVIVTGASGGRKEQQYAGSLKKPTVTYVTKLSARRRNGSGVSMQEYVAGRCKNKLKCRFPCITRSVKIHFRGQYGAFGISFLKHRYRVYACK